MRIGIVGFGRMGQAVHAVAVVRGHEVAFTHDLTEDAPPLVDRLRETSPDVLIEFTTAEAVLPNVRVAAEAGIPIVVGTTGWLDHLGDAEAVVRAGSGSLLYGSNFSIGANLFQKIVETAGYLFDAFPDYDPFIVEHHHRQKTDAPSGTAEMLAETVLQTVTRKAMIQRGNTEGRISEEALQVSSVRAGHAFGKHEVGFDGETDTVRLTHEARGLNGFAEGSVWGAEWLLDKTGVFSFSEALFGGTEEAEDA